MSYFCLKTSIAPPHRWNLSSVFLVCTVGTTFIHVSWAVTGNKWDDVRVWDYHELYASITITVLCFTLQLWMVSGPHDFQELFYFHLKCNPSPHACKCILLWCFPEHPQGGDFFLFGSFIPSVKAHSTVCDELLTLHSSISLFYTCSAFTTGRVLFYHLCWITVPILGLQNRCQYHFSFMKQKRDRERRSVTKLGLESRYLSLKLCS